MEQLPDLTEAYKTMNSWARTKLLSQALQYAKSWPDKLRQPKLNLMLNPAIELAPHLINRNVDKPPLVLIRKAIN
jgi:hypothetical protein